QSHPARRADRALAVVPADRLATPSRIETAVGIIATAAVIAPRGDVAADGVEATVAGGTTVRVVTTVGVVGGACVGHGVPLEIVGPMHDRVNPITSRNARGRVPPGATAPRPSSAAHRGSSAPLRLPRGPARGWPPPLRP